MGEITIKLRFPPHMTSGARHIIYLGIWEALQEVLRTTNLEFDIQHDISRTQLKD